MMGARGETRAVRGLNIPFMRTVREGKGSIEVEQAN